MPRIIFGGCLMNVGSFFLPLFWKLIWVELTLYVIKSPQENPICYEYIFGSFFRFHLCIMNACKSRVSGRRPFDTILQMSLLKDFSDSWSVTLRKCLTLTFSWLLHISEEKVHLKNCLSVSWITLISNQSLLCFFPWAQTDEGVLSEYLKTGAVNISKEWSFTFIIL